MWNVIFQFIMSQLFGLPAAESLKGRKAPALGSRAGAQSWPGRRRPPVYILYETGGIKKATRRLRPGKRRDPGGSRQKDIPGLHDGWDNFKKKPQQLGSRYPAPKTAKNLRVSPLTQTGPVP
jgi:hypothetical protein